MFNFKSLTLSLIAGTVLLANVGGAGAVYMAKDRNVRITNNTMDTLTEFYATTRSTWEDDMLGRGTIDAGESKRFNIDDRTGRCVFNFRAVFADGTEIVTRNIDVCATGTYTYN